MLLTGSLSLWENTANNPPKLAKSAKFLEEFFEDILLYISNPDFSREDFENELSEISDYFVEKFPKSKFTLSKTQSRTNEIISQ